MEEKSSGTVDEFINLNKENLKISTVVVGKVQAIQWFPNKLSMINEYKNQWNLKYFLS